MTTGLKVPSQVIVKSPGGVVADTESGDVAGQLFVLTGFAGEEDAVAHVPTHHKAFIYLYLATEHHFAPTVSLEVPSVGGQFEALHAASETQADECGTKALGVAAKGVEVHAGSEESSGSAVEHTVGLTDGIRASEFQRGVVTLLKSATGGYFKGLYLAFAFDQVDDGAGQVELEDGAPVDGFRLLGGVAAHQGDGLDAVAGRHYNRIVRPRDARARE